MPSQGSAVNLSDIVEFVRAETSFRGEMSGSTKLGADIGVSADDHDELMLRYTKKYGVDMSEYLWYFHTGEEWFFPFVGFIFKPPYRRVQRIDITLQTLLDGAATGKWPVSYPAHTLPRYRYDIIASYVFILAFVVLIAWAFLSR